MRDDKARRRAQRRRRAEEKHINILPKHVLFVFSFLCFIIMFLSYRFPNVFAPVKNAIDFVVSPMQKGINHVGAGIYEKRQELKDIEALKLENERLRDELAISEQKALITGQDRKELAALRELYELSKKYEEYPKVAARIIARESSGWYTVFTLDKGSRDGIAKDMNVIAGNGLVGIVTEVRNSTSTVRAIIDDNSNVSGMFTTSGDTCMVSGNMNLLKSKGMLEVSMISLNADIIQDEEIVTSHISDKYLQGILIGYVRDVHVDAGNMTQAAYLVPAVNFEKLDEVLVITITKDNED